MPWSSIAELMERKHGMRPTAQRTRRISTNVLCVRKHFTKLLSYCLHTQVHEENKYKCDECDWRFYLIAGLTCHGQDCHDTRHHACTWCVEYFDNADALYTHIRNKHYFECTICYNVSHTAEDLEEHIKEKTWWTPTQ